MSKEVLSAKVGDRTISRLESYADREGISKSEATERMVKQGLDVEESDMRLIPVRSDGGTVIEDELGELRSQVDGLDNQIEEVNNQAGMSNRLIVVMALGILVAISDSIFNYPMFTSLLLGIAMIFAVSYLYFVDEVLSR